MKRKKVYVLMVSRVFPATHPRKGEPTYFKEKILRNCIGKKAISGSFSQFKLNINDFPDPKLHTIRENYDLWSKRAEKINRGEAVLSLKQWTGSPYNYKRDGSKAVEFLRLEKIGVQRIEFNKFFGLFIDTIDSDVTVATLAKNDGLNVEDFKAWFKNIKYDEPMALIHFSDFRY